MLTLTQAFDDEGEVDKGDQHQIECVEATEDATKALESTEQSLDLIAPTIQHFLVLPRIEAIVLGRNHGNTPEIEG